MGGVYIRTVLLLYSCLAAPDHYYPDAKCVETSKPWKVFNTTSKERYRETEWGAGCYKVWTLYVIPSIMAVLI